MVITGSGHPTHGVLSSDNTIFLLADTIKSDNDIGTLMGIRKSTGMTAATFSGTYVGMKIEKRANAGADIYLGEVTADGNGSATTHCIWTSEPSGCDPDATAQLTFNPDGSVSTGDPGTKGVVSEDGSIFQVIDTNPGDGEISLIVGMKKPDMTPSTSMFGNRHRMKTRPQSS